MASEIVLGTAAHRASDLPAAHYGALGERVRSPAARQPVQETARVETGQAPRDLDTRVAPLLPPIASYARTVDQVVREEAAKHLRGANFHVVGLNRNLASVALIAVGLPRPTPSSF